MTRPEFAELVDFLRTRFGSLAMDGWSSAAEVYADFEPLNGEKVWEALLAKLDGDPKAEFPPKPPALRAAALDRIRHSPQPALPDTTEKYGWREYSMMTYGEAISLKEAVEREWARRVG